MRDLYASSSTIMNCIFIKILFFVIGNIMTHGNTYVTFSSGNGLSSHDGSWTLILKLHRL